MTYSERVPQREKPKIAKRPAVSAAPQPSRLAGAEGVRRHRPDYWLVILSAALLAIGLIVVYAISPGLSAQKGVSANYYVNKQLLAVILGAITFMVCAHVPLPTWNKLQKPLIFTAIAAALAVRLFGEEVNGAHRWIQVGGISFQAAELIKFALLIWLAAFLVERMRNGTLSNYQVTLKPLGIAIGLTGLVVAVLQSDLGSMGVMVGMVAAMVFVAGMPLRQLAIAAGLVVIATVLAIGSSGYRRERLMTYMNPQADCQDAGYQSCQALIAIGTGGMFGLGLARSVQAYGYLPEAANDSIFAIMAEKFGFAGMAALLGLFVAFFSRLKRIIERAPDDYSRLIVTGVFAWLSTQAIVNIGAMIGLLPLKGITLPFISYGGTSIIFVAGAVGLAFQISRYSTYAVRGATQKEGKGYARAQPAVFRRS
jgi:cell division protein FtsW